MLKSLPTHPDLDHLRKEAKAVLKAHNEGRAEACEVLRLLRQFRDQSDAVILGTPVQLQEVQHALSRQYGFKNWPDLMKHVDSRRKEEFEKQRKWDEAIPGQVRPESLARFALRNAELPRDIPYLDAGVPAAIMQILRHGGDMVDFSELTAASGWAFSFGYDYDNHHVAALRVGHFAFLPRRLGYEPESVSCADKEAFWSFVTRHVDAAAPMVCTHLDGGLVYGYRLNNGKREIWFDGTVGMGWVDLESVPPPDDCEALLKTNAPEPKGEIAREALGLAVRTASAHDERGGPRGLAALEAYAADVENPSKDFAGRGPGTWFCWAAFQRLSARWCCARWLRSLANTLPDARKPLLAAAEYYDKAFDLYEQYRREAQAGAAAGVSLQERARTPERIAVIAPILKQAIDAERQGVAAMTETLTMVED